MFLILTKKLSPANKESAKSAGPLRTWKIHYVAFSSREYDSTQKLLEREQQANFKARTDVLLAKNVGSLGQSQAVII